jgi:microcystin-dependent protein
MADAFIGQVKCVGFNFAPQGWAFCNGQLLAIAQYQTLYALIGTTYGGDGQNTFALPNLNGRLPMGMGAGPGLSQRIIGEVTGSETQTLNIVNLPSHNHAMRGQSGRATTATPGGNYQAADGSYDASENFPMGATSPTTGGGQPTSTIPPVTVLNWIIALEGISPSSS